MKNHRNFSTKAVDMLLAARAIAASFRENINELSSIRSDWTERYAESLETRIEEAITNYLGLDSKKDLRKATATIQSLMEPARRDLSFFKIQVSDDFKQDKERRDEILRTLGFTLNRKEVYGRSQEGMIQLLFTFSKNMTEALETEITAKGTNDALIKRIISYATDMLAANITQESFKESTQLLTREATDAFNAIHDEIIGICKKACKYYYNDPIRKEQFTFRKIVTNLSGGDRSNGNTDPVTPGQQSPATA